MAQHLSGAVLLLGAPGSGKTLLGGILARTHCNVLQVNIGQSLRATGKVQQHFLNPTGSSKQSLAQGARQLLSTACKQFKEQDPASLQR
jgi:adenylate kinase family enzyme